METPSIDESLWRDIPDRPGYQAHPDGWIRSFWSSGGNMRTALTPRTITKSPTKVTRGSKMTIGYRAIQLGTYTPEYVHRVIAKTFIPNPENKRTVNHKNGVKDDNRVENLEWATHSENLTHKCRVLKTGGGERAGTSKLSLNDACDIISLHAFGAMQKDLASAFRVSRSAVLHIINGNTWKTSIVST